MAKKSKLIDKDQGYNRILKDLASLGQPSITVGIHSEDNKPYQRGQGAAVTTAQIGTFHEFGTLDRFEDSSPAGDGRSGVPQRSFLRSTVDENRAKYADLISRGVAKVIDGSMTMPRALGLVGARAAADVQEKISKGIDPALTQQTIARKGSSKPLVDTGQLRQAIDWKIEEKK